MKLHYYLMGLALTAMATVSLTACHDDDDNDDPVYVIGSGEDSGTIKFSADTVRVKIGAENRIGLPVEESAGALHAYSLNPKVAEVVDVDGVPMIEAMANGSCRVLVSDANGVYKALVVNAYTTDVMEFESTTPTCEALVGYDYPITIKVTLGNGGYTAVSDNENVTFESATEDGVITLLAKGTPESYTAKVTVTDASNVSGTVEVTVVPTVNPFTSEDLEELCSLTSSAIYINGVHDDHLLNEHTPYYFTGSYKTNSANWLNEVSGDNLTFGWQLTQYGGYNSYGGAIVTYPANAQVGQEVEGTWKFAYSSLYWWPSHEYSGTVKVVEDSDARKVVVFYGMHAAPYQVVDYGYIVYVK